MARWRIALGDARPMPSPCRCKASARRRLVGPSALPRRVECGHQSVGCLPATADAGRTLDEPPLIVGRLGRAYGVPCRCVRVIELPQRFGDHRAVLFECGDRGGHCCPDVGRHQVGKIARLGHSGSTSLRRTPNAPACFAAEHHSGRTDAAAAGRASRADELPEKGANGPGITPDRGRSLAANVHKSGSRSEALLGLGAVLAVGERSSASSSRCSRACSPCCCCAGVRSGRPRLSHRIAACMPRRSARRKASATSAAPWGSSALACGPSSSDQQRTVGENVWPWSSGM
jgi:hypothetical protein